MKKLIEQAFRQYVLGANINEKGEVEVEDEDGDYIFIVFPYNNLEYVLVRRYWGNGQKYWEEEYRNGQLHGKVLCWDGNGQKYWEAECQNGKLICEKKCKKWWQIWK